MEEAPMTAVDDSFSALGPDVIGFFASRDEDAIPFGGIMDGSNIGMLGFVGELGLNLHNSYSQRAGIETL
jgi:hypothetical protein